MKVLVVGSGAREHALCWKLAQSPRVTKVYAAPGNAGCAQVAECVDTKAEQIDSLVAFAMGEKIDLTVVGPEVPLTMGLVDRLERAGRKAFGPTKDAARLEGSKVFAKGLMRKHNIPSADYRVFKNLRDARAYLDRAEYPLVVKADGLAAGKGVRVARDRDDALEHLLDCMERKVYGDAGNEVVVEEALQGTEASVLVVTDGKTLVVLETARDYKRACDGDQGPNTGGMGSVSPAPGFDEETTTTVEQRVLIPAIHAMNREGHPMKGILYAGLMLTPSGPRVLEFNVRFGDPETQPLMLRLKSDLVDLLMGATDGSLERVQPEWDPRPAVGVVVTSSGYPGKYETGKPILGLAESDSREIAVFHGGTTKRMGKVVTNGGRVLTVTALGDTVSHARARAYEHVRTISFDGAYYRSDIGKDLE
ncbi:phosphoribosylamine--glycine ligase [bacterium]|nr:phosphoribosylamine--glycine ligase [bacterium]